MSNQQLINNLKKGIFILLISLSFARLNGQLSPGDLSKVHENLEGISNCTQCHVLGNKVSGEKCLVCHTEIQNRMVFQKGYHGSTEVRGKDCFTCHREHNGKNFQLIRLDTARFDHKLTGWALSVPHDNKGCRDCHAAKFITDPKLKSKKFTYLGVSTDCLNCHADYHQKTLPADCEGCHTSESFKPATKFNHNNSKFKLIGKHKNIDCLKCHKVEVIEGKKFQEFRGIQFANCTNCHKDPHKNQFGQNCRQCHSEESFQVVKGASGFDHNKTNFKLEEKHQAVTCKACHKNKLTDPLKFEKCTDCHTDYHKNQFAKSGITPDCSQCHTVKGFNLFSYTVDQHNKAVFQLKGSHTAVPCTECHKKQEKWNFREIGSKCIDCHKDIHQQYLQAKYYPDAACTICHNEKQWSEITFNHSVTQFSIDGAHTSKTCRECHFKKDVYGVPRQKFTGLSAVCSSCHTDNHFKQFDKNGVTECTRCHNTTSWKESKFDHNSAAFKLDGKHINVPCAKCHKPQQEGSVIYTKYKLKEYKCESCHF